MTDRIVPPPAEWQEHRMQVTCRILLPAPDSVRPGARVRVQVEDVSLQDVSAPVLASVTISAAAGTSELGPVTIEFTPPRAGYTAIRVHVDQNGDGVVRVGDLVSVSRHNTTPDALSTTPFEPIEIPVQVVTG